MSVNTGGFKREDLIAIHSSVGVGINLMTIQTLAGDG